MFFFFLGGLLRWFLQLGLGVADAFFFCFGGGVIEMGSPTRFGGCLFMFFFFFWGGGLLRWVLELGLGVAHSCFFFWGGVIEMGSPTRFGGC